MARNKKPDDGYNAPFPSALRELLKERGETQGDIAAVTGKTRQTVSQYYNGISEPSYDTLVKIADHFDVSLDYLLGRTREPRREPSAVDELCLSPKAVENIKSILSSPYKDVINLALNPLLENVIFYDLLEIITTYSLAIKREIEDSDGYTPEELYLDDSDDIIGKGMSAVLTKEITEKHPGIKGSVVVLCGRNVLDFNRQNIEHYFKMIIDDTFGYKAYFE